MIEINFDFDKFLYRKVMQNKGEQIVNDMIKEIAKEKQGYYLTDMLFKIEDGYTQVDHLLILEEGVYVIETKDYNNCTIRGNLTQMNLYTHYESRTYKMYNPIFQNEKHTRFIKEFVKKKFRILNPPVFNIVVFTGNAKFEIEDRIKNGILSGQHLLKEMSHYRKGIQSENFEKLKPTQRDRLHLFIKNNDVSNFKNFTEHIRIADNKLKNYGFRDSKNSDVEEQIATIYNKRLELKKHYIFKAVCNAILIMIAIYGILFIIHSIAGIVSIASQ